MASEICTTLRLWISGRFRICNQCSRPITILILLFLISFLSAEDTSQMDETSSCKTIDDINFETCKPEQFDIPALKEICESIGLNVEDDVFPFLFLEENGVKKRNPDEFVHADYVSAAYECIAVAQETDYEDAVIEALMEESPEIFKEIISEVMEQSPDTIDVLLKRIEEDDPNLKDKSAEGKNFLDDPEIVTELIRELIHEETDLFDWDSFLNDYDTADDDKHAEESRVLSEDTTSSEL